LKKRTRITGEVAGFHPGYPEPGLILEPELEPEFCNSGRTRSGTGAALIYLLEQESEVLRKSQEPSNTV
jgi:hypothetical protein